jgi:hypothetical protein
MMTTVHVSRELRLPVLALAAAFVVGLAILPAAALAQQPRARAVEPAAPAASDALQHLDNFVHYTLVAKPDLASAEAQALLDSGITDAELVQLLDEGRVTPERFDAAMSRAFMLPELEDIAGELMIRMEKGRLDLARDPARIGDSIRMLTGTQRERLLAHRRLEAAGEYAVPALLRQITDGRDQGLRLAAQAMLVRIGVQAVSPLCEALPHVGDPTAQRIVCEVLGEIGYPHAGPYMLEIAQEPSTPASVREAANRALARIGVPAAPLSTLYAALALQYFQGAGSLVAFPHEDTNNIWSYDQFIGLTPTSVPTIVFGPVQAMRQSIKSLSFSPDNSEALAVFVAANLKRELDLPQGAADPIFGENQYSAAFYATVFGTRTCSDVLAMALDRRDTPLIRSAIDALAKTTGGSNLFAAGGGRRPLLEAMTYPDRRVQYESALTLGRALPQQGFAGDYAVVPLLASAVRTGGKLFAIVVADNAEDRQTLVNRLQDLGFDVVGSEASVAAVRPAIDHAVGVDLLVAHMRSPERARQALSELRTIPKTSVAPAIVLAEATDVPGLRMEYRDDVRIEVVRPGLPPETFEQAINAALDRAAGGRMSEFEAEEYAIAALTALNNIAISGSSVYSIADAESALLDALAARTGGMRLLIADVLALISSSRSQRGLFDAALASDDEFDQVDLLVRVAESVKRHGNRAEPHHLNALLDLVANATGRQAEAAAEVHGALNRPAAAAVGMLPR